MDIESNKDSVGELKRKYPSVKHANIGFMIIKIKPKWISRKDYVAPWIKAAKDRGIKLSNKNLKQLDNCHCSWASKNGGMNWIFRHCYEESIELLVQMPFKNLFMKNIPKDTFIGSIFTIPVDYTK